MNAIIPKRERKAAPLHCYLQPMPGVLADPVVVKELAILYPEVRLVWNDSYQRWQLIERLRNGTWDSIVLLRGKDGGYRAPTMANTVGFLASIDCARTLRTKWEKERFLLGLDESWKGQFKDAERDARERIEEGSNRIWHAAGKIKTFRMQPTWHSRLRSKRRSRRSG